MTLSLRSGGVGLFVATGESRQERDSCKRSDLWPTAPRQIDAVRAVTALNNDEESKDPSPGAHASETDVGQYPQS